MALERVARIRRSAFLRHSTGVFRTGNSARAVISHELHARQGFGNGGWFLCACKAAGDLRSADLRSRSHRKRPLTQALGRGDGGILDFENVDEKKDQLNAIIEGPAQAKLERGTRESHFQSSSGTKSGACSRSRTQTLSWAGTILQFCAIARPSDSAQAADNRARADRSSPHPGIKKADKSKSHPRTRQQS